LSEDQVCILVPTYNQGSYLASNLDGVINQTHDNIRLIISNDCSTDNTHDVIMSRWDALKEKTKGRLMYMRNLENLGFHENFRSMINQIPDSPQWVTICEGDDNLHNTALEQRLEFANTHGFDAVHTDTSYLYEDGTVNEPFWANCSTYPIQSPMTKEFLLMNNRVMTCSLMVKNGLFQKAFDFAFFINNGIKLCDYAGCLRLLHLGAKLGYLPNITATYRILSGSFTHSMQRQDLLEATWKVQEMGRNGSLYD
jgi:glycosyltransferase involved in cell wall biosynthesis